VVLAGLVVTGLLVIAPGLLVLAGVAVTRRRAAAQLRAGTSRSLGLIVLDLANPFVHDVARGVEEVAEATGYAVILCNTDEHARREDRYLQECDSPETHAHQQIMFRPELVVREST
jgi:ABC-type sugar transport system substrate-binding protein